MGPIMDLAPAVTVSVVCAHCLEARRVTVESHGTGRRAGRGRAPSEGQSVAVLGTRFVRHLGAPDVPIGVAFRAAWCAPHCTTGPVFEAAAREVGPRFRFLEVDTEEPERSAGCQGIQRSPTFTLCSDGTEAALTAGAMRLAPLMAPMRSQA